MYLKLPPDYVESHSGTPLPDAVLMITDIETRMRSDDARMQVAIYSSIAVLPEHRPVIERAEPSLSPHELSLMRPRLHEAMYEVLASRPEYAGSVLVLDEYLPFGPATHYNLFCLGDSGLRGEVEGRVAFGGNATLEVLKVGQLLPLPTIDDALVVNGTLSAVADVTVAGGSVTAAAPPTKPTTLTISNGTYRAGPSPVDFPSAQIALRDLSDLYAAEPSNGLTTITGTKVALSGQDPRLNTFQIPSNQAITELSLSVPLRSTVIVNWRGTSWALGDFTTTWDKTEGMGVDSSYILHNFAEATSLGIANKNLGGWVMAPRAEVSFTGIEGGAAIVLLSGVWTWNNQTAVPPASGQVRSSSGAWTDATVLNIDTRDKDGADRSADLAKARTGDLIRLEHNTDATRFARYEVRTAPGKVQGQPYYQFPVRYLDGGGTLPNSNTQIKLTMTSAPAPSVIGGLIASTLRVGSAATLRYVPFRGALPAEGLLQQTTLKLNLAADGGAQVVEVPLRSSSEVPLTARRWFGREQ